MGEVQLFWVPRALWVIPLHDPVDRDTERRVVFRGTAIVDVGRPGSLCSPSESEGSGWKPHFVDDQREMRLLWMAQQHNRVAGLGRRLCLSSYIHIPRPHDLHHYGSIAPARAGLLATLHPCLPCSRRPHCIASSGSIPASPIRQTRLGMLATSSSKRGAWA